MKALLRFIRKAGRAAAHPLKSYLKITEEIRRSATVSLIGMASLDGGSIYEACSNFVDRCNGNNNDDIRTNGELRLMKEVLPSCRVAFDVGANVGAWTSLALEFNRSLAIHCFEPSARAFSALKSRNFPENVTKNNFGLGSRDEERILHVFYEGAGINSLYVRHGLEDRGLQPQTLKETVRVETIDGYCARKNISEIDFVKIDVEGHELEVLKGAREMIAGARIRLIQFEYGGTYVDARILLKDIFDCFDYSRYSFYKIFPTTLKKYSRYDQLLENFQYQNWVVVESKAATDYVSATTG